MNRIIRRARAEDRPAIETIVGAAYAHYISRIGRKPKPMVADYAALIGEDRVHVLEDDGAVLGILVLIPEDNAMLLENIAVDPKVKGRGFGRMLLEFAESAARDAGYSSIRLYTNAAMTENIALYSKIGYVETHREGQDGFRRVNMAKPLP